MDRAVECGQDVRILFVIQIAATEFLFRQGSALIGEKDIPSFRIGVIMFLRLHVFDQPGHRQPAVADFINKRLS